MSLGSAAPLNVIEEQPINSDSKLLNGDGAGSVVLPADDVVGPPVTYADERNSIGHQLTAGERDLGGEEAKTT